jgi:Ca-activated chloride channel family protein
MSEGEDAMTISTLEPAVRSVSGLVAVDGRTYPLQSARVVARAEGGVAMTTLTQVYGNPHDEALEVIYTLALPADGVVIGYTIRIGDTSIRGEIETREKAVEAYREAIYAGRTAGLLDQDRADTFQQRLGNIPPHTRAEVEIEVLHPLEFHAAADAHDPVWEYRFPTVAGVRYEGAPGRVPDADRLDVDRDSGGIPTRMELMLSIAAAAMEHGRIVSSSHAIDVSDAPGEAVVRFRTGERLDRDIVVSWPACTPEVGVSVVEGPDFPAMTDATR